MRPWAFLCLFLTATTTAADTVVLFWTLYDAVISGGRILHDVVEGVGTVSKAIRAIDSFLDSSAEAQVTEALAKGETAEEAGKDPTAPQEVDSLLDTTAPSFNGCGALGLHIRDESLPVSRLTDCCGTHDTCYSASCGSNKRDCDNKLRTCLFSVCDDRTMERGVQQTCRGAAKLLFSGTMALSSQQYSKSQEKLSCRKPQKGWKRV
ncbi:uncharacterized protein [Panulirus ornatus]|uniref:uncharacterized protein n=1 Tax=Panulirus ornatus TaxID=150431 RepID=UPI003A85C3DE